MENRDYLLWKWQGLRLSWGVRSPSELTWESGNLVDPLLSYYGNNVSVSHMHTHTHTSVNMHHVIILSVLSWFYHSAPPSSSSPTDFRTLYFLITCSSLETKADLQAMTAPPQGPPLLKHTHTHTPSRPSRQKQITSTGISQQEASAVQSCWSRSRVQQLKRWEPFGVSPL